MQRRRQCPHCRQPVRSDQVLDCWVPASAMSDAYLRARVDVVVSTATKRKGRGMSVPGCS